mmetsp:Transcript_2134/g.5811  ORF Transcript_2134/g.5811 Transcript_2134/m.5811 type:complete len:205 (-) Transcript_2134:1330-1944(-)
MPPGPKSWRMGRTPRSKQSPRCPRISRRWKPHPRPRTHSCCPRVHRPAGGGGPRPGEAELRREAVPRGLRDAPADRVAAREEAAPGLSEGDPEAVRLGGRGGPPLDGVGRPVPAVGEVAPRLCARRDKDGGEGQEPDRALDGRHRQVVLSRREGKKRSEKSARALGRGRSSRLGSSRCLQILTAKDSRKIEKGVSKKKKSDCAV